jgi:hypothetical protein
MDDHERNLCDFYAGLAMLGLLISRDKEAWVKTEDRANMGDEIAAESQDIAHAMLYARTPAEAEEGIVALKPKRKRSK